VTRAPAAGVVRYRRYEPRGQAGPHDDTLWIGLRQQNGRKVLVKLTASPFWRVLPPYVGRRITALLDLEDIAAQGQTTGHLPLGGEIAIFVPATALVKAQPGSRVRAGETVLARL
jgi:phosphatidylserine decarboxylase